MFIIILEFKSYKLSIEKRLTTCRFSIKKIESISIIFELKIIWFWESSNELNSSKGNAYELVKINGNNKNTNKSTTLGIII